jgi:hypothetical protein
MLPEPHATMESAQIRAHKTLAKVATIGMGAGSRTLMMSQSVQEKRHEWRLFKRMKLLD